MSSPAVSTRPGTLGISEELRAFVSEMPYERGPILDFLVRAAERLPAGSRVADVGAGDAPYRELFDHVEYVTVDWEHSIHEGATRVDVVAHADAIPLEEGSFDAVVNTQVLEHVPDPARVLSELHRLLRPGGTLFLTAPLAWELHELPHDYFRYTAPGLRFLLERAGFERVEVEPRNDCFTTIAQLMRNISFGMGTAPDGLDDLREEVSKALLDLSEQVAALAPLDVHHVLPLGYAVTAVRAGGRSAEGRGERR